MSSYRCHDCARRGRVVAVLMSPGVCSACNHDKNSEDASARLARATDSIHAERRWAHLDSSLMAERLDPLWWRLSVGGSARHNGDTYLSLRDVAHVIASFQRLIITGKETGIGKTSFAVGLVHHTLDVARAAMMRGGEPSQQAEGARMVAAIDLLDPEVCKVGNAAPFVLLDDAGQEGRASGFRGQEALMVTGNLLDRRERSARKRTLVTTYGTRDEWGAWYGGRVTRLYWDMPTAAVLELRRMA